VDTLESTGQAKFNLPEVPVLLQGPSAVQATSKPGRNGTPTSSGIQGHPTRRRELSRHVRACARHVPDALLLAVITDSCRLRALTTPRPPELKPLVPRDGHGAIDESTVFARPACFGWRRMALRAAAQEVKPGREEGRRAVFQRVSSIGNFGGGPVVDDAMVPVSSSNSTARNLSCYGRTSWHSCGLSW